MNKTLVKFLSFFVFNRRDRYYFRNKYNNKLKNLSALSGKNNKILLVEDGNELVVRNKNNKRKYQMVN